MISIAVLLTVHNRKEKTLNCLRGLINQELPNDCNLDIFMTDDGCTDGTPQAVSQEFPEINIIEGDGNLYWNRGMYKAWEQASQSKDYDFYLWLNDDTVLLPDALKVLLSVANKEPDTVIVGSTHATDNPQQTTYSGLSNNGCAIAPNGRIQECYTFNGNIVLIPRKIFHKVGNLDYKYHHALGDLDYGLSVLRTGFKSCLAPQHCGICDKNPVKPAWVRPEVPFAKRWKNFHSPLAYGEPKALFHYNHKNFGLIHALKVYLTNHIRVCFPSLKKM